MQNNFVAAIEAANANNEVIISNKTISEMNNNIIDFS